MQRFTLLHPDGSKENIGRTQRDRLLLGSLIAPTAPNTYKYIGQKRTGHAMSDIGELVKYARGEERQEPDCYPGSFIWEYKQKRYRERLESSEAFVLRLQTA